MASSASNRLTTPARNFRRAHLTGRLGEALAEKFLIGKGYSILDRNYRIRGGEMDIVAKKGAIIAFVEVKMRQGSKFGAACESIDRRKKQRLLRTIHSYLAENGPRPWRCDLIAIDLRESGHPQRTAVIRHYKNIFLT